MPTTQKKKKEGRMVKEIYNELRKAIDDYWQSKYKTFATGRIKRMRTKYVGSFVDYLKKPNRKKYADAFPRCNATITRWNRH